MQLGYQVIQNGELDTRTQRAIEAFEQNEGMIVTGEVDEVLLEELTKAITREDTDAWVTASDTNTQASYQTYIAQWPAGSYVERANQTIADLKAIANDNRAWQTAQRTNPNFCCAARADQIRCINNTLFCGNVLPPEAKCRCG